VDIVMQTTPEKILKSVRSLPSIPGIAVKLIHQLNSPDTSVNQIENSLRQDPGLTTNVLKIANSSYFGFAARIGSVKKATVLLGFKRLIRIVMASCVNAVLNRPIPGYDLSPGELWRHSIAVSVAAEGLMKILRLPDSDMVFTAALLHDVGKLVLGEYVSQFIDDIENLAEEGKSFEKAVRQIIGTDHAEIGAMILKEWSFPNELIMVARWHHSPDENEEKTAVLDVVHVANLVCMMMGIGSGREELRQEPSPQAIKRLGVKTKHIESVVSQTMQWMNELNNVFASN
jgi:putative nucleotidyltransferase with HDIG domain